MPNSLWLRGLQHTRLSCPSLSPGVCSNSCPLSRWCHPTIWSSVIPFSSCLQALPASGSSPVSWLFTSVGQIIGASASVLPQNIQGWFSLGLTGWTSLLAKGPSRVFFSTVIRKHQFFGTQPSLWSNSHIYTCVQCMCAKSFQLCLTLCDTMGCSLPGSFIHGILQGRILEWVVMPFSGGSSQPTDWTHVSCVSCIGRWVFYHYSHLGGPSIHDYWKNHSFD